MLTAKGQTIDKVLGLKLGADDYMQKPFEMMELLARVEVQLRKRKIHIIKKHFLKFHLAIFPYILKRGRC